MTALKVEWLVSEQLPWNWSTPENSGWGHASSHRHCFLPVIPGTALTWQEEEAGALFSSESPADWEQLARPRERRPAALRRVSSLARAPRDCLACVRASP